MTADLAFWAPEDVEELVVAWLAPLRRSGVFRNPGDPLPYTLVTHVAGTESVGEGTADLVVSVHTLCDKVLGEDAAAAECRNTHLRMLRLLYGVDQITLTDGRKTGVDGGSVVESPRWEYYSDTILRKVGRYQIGLPYVAV